MVVTTEYVIKAIVKNAADRTLHSIHSKKWWNLQDEWVLRKWHGSAGSMK